MLIEVCFVDDKDDVDKYSSTKAAEAIVYAITGTKYKYGDMQEKAKSDSGSGLKRITEIAKEVIDGKWGNGEDRKKKLAAAGYDYESVRKKVNELLK